MSLSQPSSSSVLYYSHDTSWRLVQEAEPGARQMLALKTGAALCAGLFVAWHFWIPFRPIRIDYVTILAAAIVVLALHELAHAVTFRCRRFVAIRLQWRRRRPCIRYDGVVSRGHFLAVLAAPFLLVSLLPAALAAAFTIGSGDLVLVSLLNALFCGGDFVAAAYVLRQVAPEAVMCRQEDLMLWRPRPSSTIAP